MARVKNGKRLERRSSYVLEAAGLKVDQVELYVAVDNLRGTQFYRRFGFESYGVMPRGLRVQIATRHYAGDAALGDGC